MSAPESLPRGNDQPSATSAPERVSGFPSDEARALAMSRRWWVCFALSFEIWWVGFVALHPFYPFVDTALTRAALATIPVALVAARGVLRWISGARPLVRVLAENKMAAADYLRFLIPVLLLGGRSSKRKIVRLRRAVKRLPRSARKHQFRAWRAPTRNALWAWGLVFYPAWFVSGAVQAAIGRDHVTGVLEIFGASVGVAVVVVAARTIVLVRRTRKKFRDPLDDASTVGVAGLVIAEVVGNAPRRVYRRLSHRYMQYLSSFWRTRLLNFLAFLFLAAVILAWFDFTTLLNHLSQLSPGVAVLLIWRHRRSRKKGAGRARKKG